MKSLIHTLSTCLRLHGHSARRSPGAVRPSLQLARHGGIRLAATLAGAALLGWGASAGATERFVSPSGGHVAPFLSWDTAATNIQAAIDAADPGDVVWVTNGIYATGGKVKAGDLTNRVALDKALTVQSVNGPQITSILGQYDPATTNGPGAIRCAWLANGAVLSGFTLSGGATRAAGDMPTLQSGGGVWAASTNAVVTNCVLTRNWCAFRGGGAYSATLSRCVFRTNFAIGGGGAASSLLNNCLLTGNRASYIGGGAYSTILNNCTVVANSAVSSGGGTMDGKIQNCIVWGNTSPGSLGPDISGGSPAYTCYLTYSPTPTSISTDPRLLPDGLHFAENSPCRGAASTNYISGTDLEGRPWGNPPSMGCVEWAPEPLAVVPPQLQPGPAAGQLALAAVAAGRTPFTCWWTYNGQPIESDSHYDAAHSANLIVRGLQPEDAGLYQVVLSNAFGMSTSAPVSFLVHCADAASVSPSSPFTNWGSAAATIQEAIDAAATGDVVLVTNGTYAAGGKVMAGDLTNRVALDKALLVLSANGASATIIRGQWDAASTNGPGAVRCVWLTNGATLSGFTLTAGATRTNGDQTSLQNGGGVWAASTNANIVQCSVMGNAAAQYGGGMYAGALFNSLLASNMAVYGGGSSGAYLQGCVVSWNLVTQDGGGAWNGQLVNCIITNNTAFSLLFPNSPYSYVGRGGAAYAGPYSTLSCVLRNCYVAGNLSADGGGVYSYGGQSALLISTTVTGNKTLRGGACKAGTATNCIVWGNDGPPGIMNWSPTMYMHNSCTAPPVLPPYGYNNISVDPQFVDGVHLAVTSPCRGLGATNVATGTDLDGEPWANPPSMGCDEVWDAALTGPLTVAVQPQWLEVPARVAQSFTGIVTGRAAGLEWDFGDGPAVTNVGWLASHTWTNVGDYPVTLTAFNADNPAGVSASVIVHVVPVLTPLLSAGMVNTNVFQMTFTGQTNVTWILESATNLVPPVTWYAVRMLTVTGDMLSVSIPNATNPATFYRLRQP